MAKATYLGVSGVARKTKKMYIGVGGVARKVKKAYIGVNGVARLCWQAGIPISDLPAGTLIKISDSGGPQNFIKLKDNYEGSGRTLLLRKYVVGTTYMVWGGNNNYNGSYIDNWVNSTYLGTVDSTIRVLIAPVSIPHCPGGGSSAITTISRSVFLISAKEAGGSYTWVPNEGTPISLFATNADRKVTRENGSGIEYWVFRSPAISGDSRIVTYADGQGQITSGIGTGASFIPRPAFTLPPNLMVAPESNPDGSYNVIL